MKCEDCGFEYDGNGACSRCGYDSGANLIRCVSAENPPIVNRLENELNELGKNVQAGEVGQEKMKEFWQDINRQAKDGNLDARHMMGRAALMQKKYDIAHKILAGLADAGHALAQVDLAKIYEEGLGIESNGYDAIRLYRLAAARGNPLALFKIAEQHGRPDGLLRNDPALANEIMSRLVATYPTMFQRRQPCGSCSGGKGPTAGEFAAQSASQMSRMAKYVLFGGLLVFVIYVICTEFL